MHRQPIWNRDYERPGTRRGSTPAAGRVPDHPRAVRGPRGPDLVQPGRRAKHGYALTKDVEARLAPGTLYEALSRLEGQGLIEAPESQDRRRPDRLTAAALRAHPDDQRRVADVGLKRGARSRGPS